MVHRGVRAHKENVAAPVLKVTLAALVILEHKAHEVVPVTKGAQGRKVIRVNVAARVILDARVTTVQQVPEVVTARTVIQDAKDPKDVQDRWDRKGAQVCQVQLVLPGKRVMKVVEVRSVRKVQPVHTDALVKRGVPVKRVSVDIKERLARLDPQAVPVKMVGKVYREFLASAVVNRATLDVETIRVTVMEEKGEQQARPDHLVKHRYLRGPSMVYWRQDQVLMPIVSCLQVVRSIR